MEVGEFEVRATGEDGFGDVGLGDLDTQVIVHGPEPGVEEVVGRRGQGRAVVRAIGPLAGMGVDVGGLQGHVGRLGRDESVTRQGAREVVARDHRHLFRTSWRHAGPSVAEHGSGKTQPQADQKTITLR